MIRILLAAAFWAVPASGADTAEPSLDVISFTGSLEILSGGRAVTLKPGSAGYSLRSGSEATLISGEAVLLCAGAVVKAGAGDSFLYVMNDGQPSLAVRQGAIEVTTPYGATRSYAKGELAFLFSAPPEAVPLETPPAPPAAPTPAPPAAPTPAPAEQAPAAPAWDPIKALTARLDSGAKMSLEIELHPFYRLKHFYDSNIYLVPEESPAVGGGVVGSMVMSNELGMKFAVPISKRHKLEGAYSFKATTYAKQTKANNALDQSVGLDYGYQAARDFTLKAWESYLNTEDPAYSEIVVRERRWQNVAGGRVQKEFGRGFVVTADGQHTVNKYLSHTLGGLLNHTETVLGGSAGYLLHPKTKVFLALHRDFIRYTAGRQADSKSTLIDSGVQGELSDKIKGAVSFGYQLRNYSAAIAGVSGRARTWQAGVLLDYAYSRVTTMTLNFNRSVNEAVFGQNRFSISTGADMSWRRKMQRLTLGLDAGMQVDRYPQTETVGSLTAKRRDDIYRSALSCDYAFKEWLTGGLSYSRTSRHSIFTRQYNYEDHRTGLELRVTF